MALAEIGGNEQDVYWVNGHVSTAPWMPDETRWMMWSTVGWPRYAMCWPCFMAAHIGQRGERDMDARMRLLNSARDACGAWRPFQRESCGATQ